VRVIADHTIITQSCHFVIPAGTIIADADNQGVIQIGASNIEIEFGEGSILRGSPAGAPPDRYRGCGIRLDRHVGVRIRSAHVSGFWCGPTRDTGQITISADKTIEITVEHFQIDGCAVLEFSLSQIH